MRTLREWLHRFRGTLLAGRRDSDLEEELRLHLELAAEDAQRRGRTPPDAARAGRMRAGGLSQALDALRDQRGVPWLDALAADVVFGWRQLNKHRAASGAAILSLGLAIGATTAAFRLVDAVLLRPLPVAEPGRLFHVATTFLGSNNRWDYRDDFDYPTFREYVTTIGDRAAVMVVGTSARQPVAFDAGGEPEIAFRQFVSGNVFDSFGLRPALGRLLTAADDVTPGAHPVAVLSHDYWTRRFGRDPAVIGRTLRLGSQPFEIVGVSPKGFTGTEPGSVTDLFVPAMMNVQALDRAGWSWFRIWVRPEADVAPEQIRQMLQARLSADHQQHVTTLPADTPKERIDAYLREEIRLLPAASGASETQKMFRRPLSILAILAALVLLIACGNVANLLGAQTATRAREMALRLSIGAARWRLVQLVLVESALLALLASAAGAVFASWSAPVVVSMLTTAERPVRLILDADWRALGFGVALAVAITFLFGLMPALRASSVRPLGALKGNGAPQAQRRLANSLIAAQMAFCVFLLFVAGLFVATFERLSNKPLGFSHDRLLLLQTESRSKHPPDVWEQLADHLRQASGVESVAFAGWAPLTGNRWRLPVRAPGRPVEPTSPYFLNASAGFFETMRIAMIDGRDFRPADVPPTLTGQKPGAGVGIVNETFARVYFDGQNPIGKRVSVRQADLDIPMEIVGVVRDAVYDSVREQVRPTVYVPIDARNGGAFIVRTAGEPLALAPLLRRELSRARPDVRVRIAEAHSAFVRQQMVRERLLATLSLFFAVVALLLAGIGLYGVLNYAVVRHRREIGIRMALGARAPHVLFRLMARLLALVVAGAAIGLAGGVSFGRVVESLLFQVSATAPATVMAPVLALGLAAALAALPPAIRAVRIDPAQTLRSE